MAEAARTPWHLWVVGGLSTLWNAGGAYDYAVTQMRNEAYLAQLTEAQRVWLEGFPAFVNLSWGLAVAGAVAGALLLLARSRHAVAAFALSLAGMLVTTLYQYGFSSAPADLMTGPRIAFTVVIWIVAIALLWYAVRMRARGVLR